jgi:hypothetical protein
MQLPLYNTKIHDLSILQTRWKSIIDPVIANPLNSVSILNNIALVSGNNQISHLLGQMQQGWFLTDIDAAATIYRYQPFNSTYLYLNASAPVTVSIGVF